MKRFFCLFTALTAVLSLSSCMEKEDTPPHFVHVESVSFDVPTLSLPETKTYRLQIIFTPEDCGNKKITWYNTNPDVATVSSEGLITAKAEGVTTIGIQTSDMRRTAEVEVTVTPFIADVPITSITLSTISHNFLVTDDPLTVTATVTPENPSIPTLEWISSDEGVARVSQEGVVTPVGHGRATITAKANDGSKQKAECKVTVSGVKDRNYDGADGYYKLIYYPVNIEVTLSDGTKAIQTWLDRNLGAKKVAESKDDYEAYGSLFQWSRKADGHEQMAWTSATAGTLVNAVTAADEKAPSRANAGHGKFILVSKAPFDWASETSTQESGLWGGSGGSSPDIAAHAPLDDESQASNPCPEGYRLPSAAELYAMTGAMLNTTIKHGSGSAATPAVADPCTLFAESDLHIPSPGFAAHNTGVAMNSSTTGALWAATSGSPSSGNYNNGCRVYYASGAVQTSPYYRARGCTVRCIRDTPLETTSLED